MEKIYNAQILYANLNDLEAPVLLDSLAFIAGCAKS